MGEPLVVMTAEQLRALVCDAVRDAMGNGAQNTNAQYLTLDQTAELLQVDARTVRTWVKSNGLPALRVGREYRFRRDTVLEWLESRAIVEGAHVSKHTTRIKALKKV